MEYPKFLPRFNVVARDEVEEAALLQGRATVAVVKADAGDVRSVALSGEERAAIASELRSALQLEVTPEPAPEPFSEPAAMIAAAQETFTRRKSKRKGK